MKLFDKDWMHKINFIIKYNKPLPEHPIKNEICQLLSKDNHGSNIYEHGIK